MRGEGIPSPTGMANAEPIRIYQRSVEIDAFNLSLRLCAIQVIEPDRSFEDVRVGACLYLGTGPADAWNQYP
jgi:hypothetical protein